MPRTDSTPNAVPVQSRGNGVARGFAGAGMNREMRADCPNLDATGIYTVPMAARLIGADRRRVRSWIDGHGRGGAAPVIRRQLPRIGGRTALGFLDLVEARFIRHLGQWFGMRTIRRAADRLRTLHEVDHPFATKDRFMTDGKSVFMEAADRETECRALDLMNDGFVMEPAAGRSPFDSVFYVNDLARTWRPLPETAPRVLVDPRFTFGRPVIEKYWVPTDTLADACAVEWSAEAAAEEYAVDEEAVLQAVAFERRLDERTVR